MSRFHRLIHYPWRPRFYYGWAMAPIATLSIMCTAPAQTYGISVFTPFIRASLNLSPAQVAGAYMAGTLLASLPLTLIGSLMDRYGMRRTLFVVICCFSAACVALSQAAGLLSLFAAFFVLRLFGQGSLTLLSGNTLAFWFYRRLGFVSGLKAMGAALTIALAPRIHYLLIQHVGWRTAYVLLGAMIALLLLPLVLFFFRNRPQEIGQHMDGIPPEQAHAPVTDNDGTADPSVWTFGRVLRTRAYWIITACIALWSLIGTAVAFCAPSIFESRGLTSAQAAERTTLIFTAMGLTLLAGNVMAGYMADRVRLHRMLCVGMLSLMVVGFVLRLPGSEHFVLAIGCAMGVSQALLIAVGSTIWVRYFGQHALGRIRGSSMTTLVAASSLGPFLLDGMAARLNGYHGVLTFMMLLPLPFAIAAGWLASKPRELP